MEKFKMQQVRFSEDDRKLYDEILILAKMCHRSVSKQIIHMLYEYRKMYMEVK